MILLFHYLFVKLFICVWIETIPICREIDKKKADYLIYDTTGFESFVAENNPKFFNSKLKQTKKSSKTNDTNSYAAVCSILPSSSNANPEVRQQYINGHLYSKRN